MSLASDHPSSSPNKQNTSNPRHDEKEPDIIVIDIGTGSIKAGWAGEDAPRCCIPTILLDHHSISSPATIEDPNLEFTIGSHAWHHLGLSVTNHHKKGLDQTNTNNNTGIYNGLVIQPIERGQVKDWDGLSKIWEYIFKKELRCNPKDHPVLLTLPPLASPTARSEMAKIMFDHFAVPSLAIANQAVLALYSTGRTTGVVLELGEGMSYSVPIYEGYALNHAILSLPLAGYDLTHYLSRILGERGCTFHQYQADTVRDIKEKLCRVRSHRDATAEHPTPNNNNNIDPSDIDTYELPDGTIIRIDDHCRYSPPECLYDPRLLGLNSDHLGIHKMVWESILKCDTYLRKQLLKNIVVSGGTSMIKGFGDRMKREISALYHADPQTQLEATNNNNNNNINIATSKDSPIQIITDSQRKYGTWIGGSMYASLPTFSTIKITETEYKRDEQIVHKKYV